MTNVVAGVISGDRVVSVDSNNNVSGFNNVTGSGKITTTDLQVNGSTTADSIVSKSAAGAVLKLQTSSTDIQGDDLLGKIEFQAPDEGTGDASNMVAASIVAKSEGNFSKFSNATKLSFMTGSSQAASERLSIDSSGNVNVTGGNLTVSGDTHVTSNLSMTVILHLVPQH